MRGASFAGDRKIEFLNVPDPQAGLGEVVLEIKASGICGSDLYMYRGGGSGLVSIQKSGPIIGGHEPCGVVVDVGPGVPKGQAKLGDRMMVHHYSGCRGCDHCRGGWAQLCETEKPLVYGVNAHGAHAPFLKVPAHTLVPLPDELSFEGGAAISCGSGTAYAGLKRMHLEGDDTVAIFGQGPVGLAGTQLAAAMGARVIALDVSPERLELARQFGADAVINPATDDPVAAIKELTRGRGADLALEASGNPQARRAAVRCLRIWGTVCLVGARGELTVEVGPELMQRQITIIGSWTFSTNGQADCARFAAERGVAVDKIVTDRWPLDGIDEAYRVADAQNSGKGMIVFN